MTTLTQRLRERAALLLTEHESNMPECHDFYFGGRLKPLLEKYEALVALVEEIWAADILPIHMDEKIESALDALRTELGDK